MKKKLARAIAVLAALSCSIAMADWDPGDVHIMQEAQLPDTGTDALNVMVDATNKPQLLADDWVASRTTSVRDLHFWYSWNINAPVTEVNNENWLLGVNVAIHENTTTTNMPGQQLWSSWFDLTSSGGFDLTQNPADPDYDAVEARLYDPTAQGGWADPFPDGTTTGNTPHVGIWQLNIYDLAAGTNTSLFQQQEGETYWLSLAVEVYVDGDPSDGDDSAPELGWHTSGDGTGNAVYNEYGFTSPTGTSWQTIGQTNLAYTLTPEPSALALLLLAGLSVTTARKRRE